MSGCAKLPLELVLSTNDPSVYEPSTGKWGWSGDLYWTVECLPDNQRSVSDGNVPNLDSFVAIDSIPMFWDFCSASNCVNNSRNFLIAFTFNPNSNDPNDYLQYVIDGARITDQPRHAIVDSAGKNLYIIFKDLEKSANMPYLELWIHATSRPEGAINTISVNETSKSNLKIVWIILAVIAGIALISVVGWFAYIKFPRSTRTLGPPV